MLFERTKFLIHVVVETVGLSASLAFPYMGTNWAHVIPKKLPKAFLRGRGLAEIKAFHDS